MGKPRNKSAVTHGAYSLQAHGKAVMTELQLSARAELIQQLKDKQGVIEVLREHTAEANTDH